MEVIYFCLTRRGVIYSTFNLGVVEAVWGTEVWMLLFFLDFILQIELEWVIPYNSNYAMTSSAWFPFRWFSQQLQAISSLLVGLKVVAWALYKPSQRGGLQSWSHWNQYKSYQQCVASFAQRGKRRKSLLLTNHSSRNAASSHPYVA